MARELTVDEIHAFVRQFGEAAGRAKKCGFDGIEIHAGHGYLIAAFLSFYQNHRTDEYGGPLINRVRFLHEIYDEMRKNVADKEDQGKVNFMRAFCEQRHVNFLFLHTINELAEDGLVLTHKGVAETHAADWVVLSCGYVPVNGLVDELADLGDKVVVIGDAVKCRDAEDAGNEGFDAGYNA